MIGRSVRRTKLVERTYEDIEVRIGDYHVMTIDDNVVGCVALHEYPGEAVAEVACLYVKLNHEGRGYGVDLVHHAEKIAAERGIPRVFALTTRAADFFQNRVGYTEREPEILPQRRFRQLEESGRGSKVFEKILATPS
nr:GNAT family N-acetyltransferase [Luteolibacter marinus]